jgi:hypothetical protein
MQAPSVSGHLIHSCGIIIAPNTNLYLSFTLPSIDTDPNPPIFAESGHFPNGDPLTLADDGQPCETVSRDNFKVPSSKRKAQGRDWNKKTFHRALEYYSANAHRWPRRLQRRWLELALKPGYCYAVYRNLYYHQFFQDAMLDDLKLPVDDVIEVSDCDPDHPDIKHFYVDMCDTGAYVFAPGLFGPPSLFP